MNYQPSSTLPTDAPTPVEQKKLPYVYSTFDIVLAVALWVIGYLFCNFLPAWEHPIPAFLFEVAFLLGTAILLTRPSVGGKHSARSWLFLGVSLALAVSLLISTNRAIINCVIIWNCLSWFYTVYVMLDNSRERFPGGRFVGELATATVVMPFRAPGNLFAALFGKKYNADGTVRTKGRLGGMIGWVALGLLLAIIPAAIVLSQLSYDEGFTAIMDNIWETIFEADTLFRQLRNLLIGLPIGALLFGALLAAKHQKGRSPKPTAPLTTLPTPDGAHVLPVALVAAALTPVLVIYIIFFISQWDYYISAFTGVRPEELTYSTYAREGFFELVTVSVVNAVLSLAAAVFSVRRALDPDRPRRERLSPVIRIYLAVLALFTLVLIATALSKMFLYVDTYGMTQKRIYATWLMLLLAVAFVAVILRQLWTRMNLTGTLLVAFLAFFLAISLVNVDTLIVRYNVDIAKEGNLHAMKGDVCRDSGASGVLAALDFMEASADPAAIPYDPAEFEPVALENIRTSTDAYLQTMTDRLDSMKWYEHNLVTLRARAALEEAGYIPSPIETD